MTLKPPSLAVTAMLGLFVMAFGVVGAGEASAQFGFFFPQQRYQQRGYRSRQRPRPQPARPRQAVPVQPLRPEPSFPLDAEIPQPPPRPHFPGDPPAEPATQPKHGTTETPAPPTEPLKSEPLKSESPKPGPPSDAGGPKAPPESSKSSDGATPAAPLPPEKPEELAKPEMPARPQPPVAEPRRETSPTTKPSMTVRPVPDELPPKGPASPPKTPDVAPEPKTGPSAKPEPSKPEPSKPEAPTPAAPGTAPPTPSFPPLPPPKPPELKPSTGVAPSGARLGEVPRQPQDDATCEDRLKARNVSVETATIGPQSDERCTVVRPVRLLALTLPDGGKVEFPEHPTIACPTADAFSLYVRDLLAPLAKGTFGTPVSTVWTGPGLECRSRDHIVGAKLSAHGQGLAIDIAQFKLADGRKIEVGKETDETTRTFAITARLAACGYFHTVLGPGTDSFHTNHWHFDLMVRGTQGDSKYCR